MDEEEFREILREENNRRFDSIEKELIEMRKQMTKLNEFKIQVLSSSKVGSFLISAFCGIITLIASLWLTASRIGG